MAKKAYEDLKVGEGAALVLGIESKKGRISRKDNEGFGFMYFDKEGRIQEEWMTKDQLVLLSFPD